VAAGTKPKYFEKKKETEVEMSSAASDESRGENKAYNVAAGTKP